MKYNKVVKSNISITDYFEEDPLLFSHIKKNIVNLDKTNTQPAFRAYKDESTSAFVATFLNNEDTLNQFIDYNFHVLHYFIMANINESLSKNGEILKSDEDIFIIFKGGNVMHFYFDKIIQEIKSKLTVKNPEYIQKVDDLNKYFKTSDVDTSFYIINNDEQKFNLIYYYVSNLLISALLFIRNSFDNFLQNKIKEKIEFRELEPTFIYMNSYNNQEYDIYTIHILYKNFCEILEKYSNDNNEDFIKKFKKYMGYFCAPSSESYYIFKDSYLGSRYISTLQLIKFYYKSNNKIKEVINLEPYLKSFIEKIDKIIELQNETIMTVLNNKLSKFNGFYTEDKLNKFLEILLNKFNSEDYQNKHFFNHTSNPSTDLVINRRIDKSQLIITDRNDFALRCVNSIYYSNLVLFPEKSNHFISINNVISNYIGNEHIVLFDLYRVKFNVLLKSIFNVTQNKYIEMFVPSEFLDISIPKFYDFNLTQLRDKLYNTGDYVNYFSKLDNNKLECYNILTTNLKYTIKDLNTVLYEQNTFIPWNDLKYNKRIIRSLFLMFVVYYKKAKTYESIDLVDSVLDTFIKNLTKLSSAIETYFSNKNNNINNDETKILILSLINKIIYFNNNNNLLNLYTLLNFYDYKNKSFFKIKYYDYTSGTKEYEVLSHVFHGEMDLSINVILKNIFFIIEDYDIYKLYIDTNLNHYNYVFNSPQDKNNYINNVFIEQYIKFTKTFVENIIFMKELIFDNMKRNAYMPVDDLLLGGSKSFDISKFISTNGKQIQFSNLKLTDVPFKTMKQTKLNNKTKTQTQPHGDLEDLEMIN